MAAAGLFAVPAVADGYGSIKDAPAPYERPHVWTGAYVGVHLGYAKADDSDGIVLFDTDLDGDFDDTVRTGAGANAFSTGFCNGSPIGPDPRRPAGGCSDDDDGFEIGVRIGYDKQYGNMVLGAVFEVTHTDIEDSTTAFSTTPAFYTFTRELEWSGSLRLRAGVLASEKLLLYVTGGVAYGDFEDSFSTSNAVNSFAFRGAEDSAWGYVIGAGGELMLTHNVSLGIEYLYTDLGDSDFTTRIGGPIVNPFTLVNPTGTDLIRTDDSLETHAIRATLNYRFN